MKNYDDTLIETDSDWIVAEPEMEYGEQNYPFKKETYKLIGLAMKVHSYLGNGFDEIVYKDALVKELNRENILFEREKKYEIEYRGVILPHHFFADFVVDNKIIFEVKAQKGIHEEAVPQVLNYLAASKLKIGLIVNFGEGSLRYKRVIFSRKDKDE